MRRFNNTRLEKPGQDNNAVYDYVPLLMGMSKAQLFFGETPDEDTYLEAAFNLLRKGFLPNVYQKYHGVTDKEGTLCLPYLAEAIDYVTTGNPDRATVSFRVEQATMRGSGRFIPFKFYGDRIETSYIDFALEVAYWGPQIGEDGFPMVTEQLAEACAWYWKKLDTQKQFYQGNQLASGILQKVEFEFNKAINQARVPVRLSQNFINQYGNIIFSRNQHRYGKAVTKLVNTA